jgi:hypothetical protein
MNLRPNTILTYSWMDENADLLVDSHSILNELKYVS